MWMELKIVDAPKETFWFGPGGVIAISPAAFGTILVFDQGKELCVEDDYSWVKACLIHSNPTNPSH